MLPLVFVIGDSISMGYGPHLEKMLAGTFRYARKTGLEAGAAGATGANGGDSARVLDYIEAMRGDEAFRPDCLVVNCGLHDVKIEPGGTARQVELDDYKRNLQRIVEIGASVAGRMVWVRTTPVDDAKHHAVKPFDRRNADVKAYNAAADKIMQAAGIDLIDLYAFTVNIGALELSPDGVHFEQAAQAQQGAFVAGFLTAPKTPKT
ncbi:MAG: SGNH/GDSL hydrolase family protein [Planctomycetes bacterium]|nr:SGNH/GDSL hydrolase family protein [Planctomycetota bacterium]